MDTISRNKVIIFMIFIFSNLLLGVFLLNMPNFTFVGLSVLSMSAVVGTIVYLADFHNGVKICVSCFSVLIIAFVSYLLYIILHKAIIDDQYLALSVSSLFGMILLLIDFRYQIPMRVANKLIAYLEAKGAKDGNDFKVYRRDAIYEWFWSQPNSILNQPISKTLIRIFIMIAIGAIGIEGLINQAFSVFHIDALYDKLFFVCLILYSIMFFLTGFRRSAAPAFVAWTSLLIFYFIHLYFFSENHPFSQYLFAYKILIFFLVGLCVFTVFYLIHNEFYYSNVQMYERDEECITVDLFVSEYAPITDLNLALIFAVGFADYHKRPKHFIRMLRSFVLLSLSYDSVFVGYTTQIQDNQIVFYVYTKAALISKLTEALDARVKKIGYEMTVLECREDAQWKLFDERLYPNEKELCAIVSRSYIEELFKKGASFDQEYQIGFFVNFKDKNDPIDFEHLIKFYGFNLKYASFDESNCLNEEYRYYGEYEASSYISSRRIEYLNQLLLEKCEDYGALYLGEWQIDEQN